MIKARDRNTPTDTPACYEEASESAMGIAFEKRTGRRRYALCAFLSAVDLNSEEEMIFHFTIGKIIVRGENLECLWQTARRGVLVRVWECERPKDSDDVWVRELDFIDLDIEDVL